MTTILLTLNEAKSWLSTTEGDKDSDIQAVIDAAAKVIESRVGPIDQATKVQTFTTSGTSTLVLGFTQVMSVSSLTLVRDGSSPMSIAGLVCDANTGIVRSKSEAFPTEPFTITYVVGPRAVVDANLELACRRLVQTWWKARRGNGQSPRTGQGGDATTTARGIPADVEALLSPHSESLGFA